MRDKIRFIHKGQIRELECSHPTKTVLNFLRYEDALTGTKEGCAEGDCGACTVVLGSLENGELKYNAVNACIQFLPMLDGKELITVEDLQSENGELHPVQQSLVDTYGTQCGFCTPGFVMSMFAEMHGEKRSDVSNINDILAGNLCRCTGYGTIIEAAQKAANQPTNDKFADEWNAKIELLSELEKDASLSLDGDGGKYFAPKSKQELAELLAKYPDATILAGATDIGLWVTKMHKELPCLIYVGQVKELKEIEATSNGLKIGAGATYSEAWKKLEAEQDDLGELIRRIASTQIRNSGTIGGNIANGSPIGDMPPALITLGAKLELQSANGIREIELEDFFIAYGKQDLKPGEFVSAITIPKAKANAEFRNYKISKRFDQDITAVNGAFYAEIEDGVAHNVRIAFGGMAATPARAKNTEAALEGKAWTEEAVKTAIAEMKKDYAPISDVRATSDYRLQTASNLVMKFFLETTSKDAPSRLVGTGGLRYA